MVCTLSSRAIPSIENMINNNYEQTADDHATTSKPLLSWITDTIEHNNSWTLKIFLIFILGLLMSLTPCIYPMIPITAGILQTQGSRSLLRSFLLALSYTVGLATTFAFLGLLAAFAGQAMGQLMNQPLFIIPLVLLLIYLSLAMMGFYEMYIPRFLQPKDHAVKGGSFISAFIFGIISGVVASPCLSPGLLCLLCLVTTLGSKILGFLLLFVFGIGLGIPLLIIGTFSSSLALLPRAGMWMVEIKKLFGFLMLGMCLYFLNFITPWYIMKWVLVIFALGVAILLLTMAAKAHNRTWRMLYAILGVTGIAISAFLAIKAVQQPPTATYTQHWKIHYQEALMQARDENKKLFVDIGAPFCSICKAIDNTLFANSSVVEFIQSNTIPVKIDGSDATNSSIINQFNVLGFPTVLLIDAQTENIIKRWGPELYGIDPAQFIDQLNIVL